MEKWAVYSSYPAPLKIIGSLTEGIYKCLGYQPRLQYVSKKHILSIHHMDLINLNALHSFLEPLPFPTRATYAKSIHNWIPTHAQLCPQGRERSPLCPRCNRAVEAHSHIITCNDPQASESRHGLLYTFLHSLAAVHSPIHIISTLEYKLALTLDVPCIQTYKPLISLPPDIHYKLISTIRIQNIIGWDSFLNGFIASSWMTLFEEITNFDPPISHKTSY